MIEGQNRMMGQRATWRCPYCEFANESYQIVKQHLLSRHRGATNQEPIIDQSEVRVRHGKPGHR